MVRNTRELDQNALTAAHIAVEDVLIEYRDSRLSVMGPANGLIVKERDGSPSSVMRIGTRDALRIGIAAYLNSVSAAVEVEYRRVRPDGRPRMPVVTFETMPALDEGWTAEYRELGPWVPVTTEAGDR